MKHKRLYRPVGLKELAIIQSSGFKTFPPRLHWQPIFYPVLDYDYACSIAREWNTKDEGSGYAGFVTEFDVVEDYLKKFNVQNVGAVNHNELWVPAEELDMFNSNIIGGIRVINAFYGTLYVGDKDYTF